MSSEFCAELCDALTTFLRCERPRVYLVGDVVVLACSKDDIVRTFRAIGEPPYVPAEKVRKTHMRKPAIAVHDCAIVIGDIPDFDQALVLSSVIARELVKYMPFKVSHVDLHVTYRCSEDGGLFTRYAICVYIVKNYCDELRDVIKQEIENIVNTMFRSEEESS